MRPGRRRTARGHVGAPPAAEQPPEPRTFQLLAFGWQAPPTQLLPEAQSVSRVHALAQAVGPQTKGLQAWVWTAGQAPVPLQEAARVAAPPVQLGARHCTELPG
jgi:hypothetical protein